MDFKNIAKGSFAEVEIEEGFYVLICQNDQDQPELVTRHIERDFIQFHFVPKGQAKFLFNQGRYGLDLVEDHSLLLYNPQQELPILLQVEPQSAVVTILISIKKFHGLFSLQADYISFLSKENRDKKYYKEESISASMAVVLIQIINYTLNSSVKNLYFKAKAFELLSLYFNRNEDVDHEQCPFLVDEANVVKIRKAKDIVIARMAEPPTLKELSEEVGLNLKKLKEGFKQIYGDSVYSFLFDYKMEVARKLLESNSYNVNEVGLKVGYSTSSHFIAAFKKKYGTTPKKYLMSLV